MRAGDLRDRVQFEARSATADGHGNHRGPFVAQFSRFAQFVPLRGDESVIAGRLQGKQPTLIRVRLDAQTKTIAPDWQVRELKSDRVFAVKSIEDPTRRGEFLEILAESGIAS